MKHFSLVLLAAVLTLPALRAETAAPATAPAYPLTTCVVSGESLTDGDMGGPVTYVHKEEGKPDRVVQLCCKMCIGKFKKDPAKYLKKIDEAAAVSPAAAPAAANEQAPAH